MNLPVVLIAVLGVWITALVAVNRKNKKTEKKDKKSDD